MRQGGSHASTRQPCSVLCGGALGAFPREGPVQISFFGLQRSQIERIFFASCVSTKPKRRCLGKRSPPRRHPQPPAVDIIRTILAERSQSQTHTHYNMTTIDFGSSGQRLDVTLEDVAAMALLYGFERPGPHAPTKPTSQRANLSDFFNVYGVNAFSKFKDKFRRETLLPPEEQKAKQEQKVSGSQNCRCALLDRMTQSDRLPIFPGNR